MFGNEVEELIVASRAGLRLAPFTGLTVGNSNLSAYDTASGRIHDRPTTEPRMFCPSSLTFNPAILVRSSAKLRTEASLTGENVLPITILRPPKKLATLGASPVPRAFQV